MSRAAVYRAGDTSGGAGADQMPHRLPAALDADPQDAALLQVERNEIEGARMLKTVAGRD